MRTEKTSDRENSSPPSDAGLHHLLRFIRKWARRAAPPEDQKFVFPPPARHKFSPVLFLLKLLPIFAVGLFILSLFWDLKSTLASGIVPQLSSDPIRLDGLLRMLSVCALVGFGTNWIAIKMLFYPRNKRPLLGQGLIPSRKDRIVLRLGDSISKEIINSELIMKQIRKSGLIKNHRLKLSGSLREMFSNSEFQTDLMNLSRSYLTAFLRSPEAQKQIREIIRGIDFEQVAGLEGGLLRFYRFFKGDRNISEQLHTALENISFRAEDYEDRLASFLDTIPDILDKEGDALEDYAMDAIVFLIEQVNVRQVIVENLSRFDEIRLERLLMSATSDQLQYIQYLGCLFGFLGGLIIWRPVEFLSLFIFMAGIIWMSDIMIMRLKKSKP